MLSAGVTEVYGRSHHLHVQHHAGMNAVFLKRGAVLLEGEVVAETRVRGPDSAQNVRVRPVF